MARPDQQAIQRFMKITGVSEAVAVQKLEKSGDVIDALNEHFNEGDGNVQGEVMDTPTDVTDGNQYTPQDEQTNKISSATSLAGNAKEDEQMKRFHLMIEYARKIDQEQRNIERAISLSIETAEQERAQRLQGDVRVPIVGPPESSLGKIAASDGRFQKGTSSMQDEGEDAREQPLIQKRSRPISLASTDLAENVMQTSTMSSSGNRDTYSNRQHNRNAIHEEEELERQLAVKKAYLPPEPSVHDENAVTLQVKMPDGNHLGRRFLTSDNLQYIFDFLDVSKGVKPGTYRLVRQDPRRAFSSDGEGALTLNEVGLTKKHEVLYLELI